MSLGSLFDTLSNIPSGGHGVNRGQLNYQIAQAQSMNGWRSAQTEQAWDSARVQQLQAQLNQNKIDAQNAAGAKLGAVLGNVPLGQAVVTAGIAGLGNANEVGQGLNQAQELLNRQGIANPATDPNQRALLMSANTNKPVDPTVPVSPNYTVAPGMPAPNVQQTPLGVAQTSATAALGDLHANEATNPQLYHPGNLMGQVAPGDIAMRGHLIATGQSPWPTPYELARNPQAAYAAIRAAVAENPGVSASLMPQLQATVKDFSGEGKNGQRLIGYGTVENHLSLATQAVAALNNGTFTPANAIYQEYEKLTGKAPPTNLQALGPFIGAEVFRALSGAQIGTGEERTKVQDAWTNLSRSPDQLNQAIDLTNQLVAGGKAQLRNAYEAGTRGLAGTVPGIPTFDQILGGIVPNTLKPPGAPAPNGPGGATPAAAPAAAISLDQYLKSKGF